MAKWTMEFWTEKNKKIGPVEQWLDELKKEQAKAVAQRLELLRECGNELRLPNSKALGKGLFELRERRFGYRIYYGFCDGCIIILLAAGDKKTQNNDIKIARQRLLDI